MIRLNKKMKTCIYCNLPKSESEFENIEHIFPESLGGKACNELFKTRSVCRECNSFCGLWVDGAFLKDSFIKNYKALDDFKYVDFENGSVHSLTYLGRIDTELTNDNEICEAWIGPCADKIFHFHSNSDERFFSYTGGNPISYKKDPGRVFFFTGTNNPKWFKIALLSFYNHFKKAKRFSGNAKIKEEKGHQRFFSQSGSDEMHIIDELKKIINSPTPINIKKSGKFDIEQVFFSKISLGLGFNLLGSRFLTTPHAEKLRENIKNSNKNEKVAFNKVCSPFFKSDQGLNVSLAWEGGHTFVFFSTEKHLVLLLSLFGHQFFQVLISDTPELWAGKNKFPEKQVYILIPQRSIFKGPIQYDSYISYLNGHSDIPELSELRSLVVDGSTLPPYFSE